MNKLKELKLLLKCDNLSEDWNLSYGLTRRRNDALTEILDRPHQNSFYNPNPKSAETVLTLFMLGNVDCWKQICGLNILPRKKNKNGDWNGDFFNKIQNNQNILWKELFKKNIRFNNINFQKSILLFEFRIMNSAFHSVDNSVFKELSFLDIGKKSKWSQFDAVLMIPCNKLFVFFEAKLKGYRDDFIKEHTTKPPQILRNLESAYLLTNHEESHYKDWDFIYVFISPSDLKDKDKYYSMLDNAGTVYEEILEEMQKSSCFKKYFVSFKNDISKHIIKKHWDEVGSILKKNKPTFFNSYLKNLENEDSIEKIQIGIIRKRFSIAGIEL